jgi:hypothetical protein
MDIEKIIVYGWKEANNECIIDNEWLLSNNIQKFAYQLYKNYPTEIIYGFICQINQNGDLVLSKKNMKNMELIYNIVKRHNEYYNIEMNSLGYFTVPNIDNIDVKWDHFKTYIPMDENELDILDELEELDGLTDFDEYNFFP